MLSNRPGNMPSSSIPEPIFSKKCRRTTLFWVIALVFIAIWMFFLGVLVGRGTLPFLSNPLQSELIAQGSRQIPDKPTSETAPVVSRIKFFEALKGSETTDEDLSKVVSATEPEETTPPSAPSEGTPPTKVIYVPATQLPAQKPTAETAKPTTSAATATKSQTVFNAATKTTGVKPRPVATTPAKLQTTTATPAPMPAKPAVFEAPKETTGKWTLQVMATKSDAEAQALVKKLSAKGYSVHIQKADIPGQGTMYRVQIGTFSNRAAAEVLQGHLKKDGYAPIIKTP